MARPPQSPWSTAKQQWKGQGPRNDLLHVSRETRRELELPVFSPESIDAVIYLVCVCPKLRNTVVIIHLGGIICVQLRFHIISIFIEIFGFYKSDSKMYQWPCIWLECFVFIPIGQYISSRTCGWKFLCSYRILQYYSINTSFMLGMVSVLHSTIYYFVFIHIGIIRSHHRFQNT